jgi:toxin ParE1/3/4
MKLFALTYKAKSDLRDIALFTQQRWGIEQRDLYVRQFDDLFHTLAKNPELGKSCNDILPGYRKFPQGSHVVFYKLGKSHRIEVVRILHKNMDVENHIEK